MTLRKAVTEADCTGGKLLDGLCPDETHAFMDAMTAKSANILKQAERIRDLIQDLKLVNSVVGRTDFVQELDNAAATQTKMTFMVCTWTATIVHSNPVTWSASAAGRDSLATLKSVVASVNEAPEMLAMEHQLDTAIWKQLRADLKMPVPPAAAVEAPSAAQAPAPASASGQRSTSTPAPASAASGGDDTLELLTALGGDGPPPMAVAPRPASGAEQATVGLPYGPADAAVASPAASGPPQVTDGLPYSPAPPAADIASQETVPGAPVLRSPEVVVSDTLLDDDAAVDELFDELLGAVPQPRSPATEILREPAVDATAECEEAARKVAAASTASGPDAPPAVIVAQLAKWGRRPASPSLQASGQLAALVTVSIEQPAPEIAGDPAVGPITASGRPAPCSRSC